MITDTERLDCLQKVLMNYHSFDAKRDYDPFVNSPTYGYKNTITIFTVLTQHITVNNIREGLDYLFHKMKEKQ